MKNRLLQDFSLIHQNVRKARADQGLANDGSAFYYVVLQSLLDLQDDETDNAITDNYYQAEKKRTPGKDRGIDAVYLDSRYDTTVIHLFNCKYSASFEKTQSFFPAAEIDKIESFLFELFSKDAGLLKDTNPALQSKIREVWQEVEQQNPIFVVHLCSNLTEGLEPQELSRLHRILSRYSNFRCEEETQSSLSARLAHKGRVAVNGKIRAIDKNLFEISGGDVRALILHVEARDFLRLLCDRDELRNNPAIQDITTLHGVQLQEEVFEDNIRVYLQQRSKVNRNIKATALSDENSRFFYFNNGITIRCDRFRYPKSQRAPIVEIENIQVVNGGQTVHALFEAFQEKPQQLEPIELLCRLYETSDPELSSRIAECTNSQSPVKTRDIRSIDVVQVKLEKEFAALGLFYERKKNQFVGEDKDKRLDAEKCGQVALAFYYDMPLEAKNKKGLIFGDRYDDIFSENVSAETFLLPFRLFQRIEQKRASGAVGALSWLQYGSYHLLYTLKALAKPNGIELTYTDLEKIWSLYRSAKRLVARTRNTAKRAEKDRDFADVLYFKSSQAKRNIDAAIAQLGGKTKSNSKTNGEGVKP